MHYIKFITITITKSKLFEIDSLNSNYHGICWFTVHYYKFIAKKPKNLENTAYLGMFLFLFFDSLSIKGEGARIQLFLSLARLALESDQIIYSHLNRFTVFTGGLACDQFLPHWFEFHALLLYKHHTKMHNLFRLNIMLWFITHLNIEQIFCTIYF